MTEPYADFVTVGDKKYPVNTDFRIWLNFAKLTASANSKKAVEAIILCYKGGALPPSFFEAFEALWEFFLGKPIKKTGNSATDNVEKIFDFEQDAELIYASFLYDYGIDLKEENMHWHRFLALFKNLSPDSPFMRVAGLRSVKPDEIKDKNRRSEIIKRQRAVALEMDFDEKKFANKLAKLI